MFLDIGVAGIQDYIFRLTDYAVGGLQERGFKVVSPRGEKEKSGIVAVELASLEDAERLHQKLDRLNFVLSRYGRIMRVAPHFFNEQSEITALLQAMGHAA